MRQPLYCVKKTWHDSNEIEADCCTVMFDWLTKPYILSEAIKRVSRSAINVQLLKQQETELDAEEAAIISRTRAVLREVFLVANNMPWVYARVIIPTDMPEPYYQKLLGLGEKPIGVSLLYNDPEITRSGFQYKLLEQFCTGEAAGHIAFAGKNVWARRSVFTMANTPLLISEFFAPNIPAYRFF